MNLKKLGALYAQATEVPITWSTLAKAMELVEAFPELVQWILDVKEYIEKRSPMDPTDESEALLARLEGE